MMIKIVLKDQARVLQKQLMAKVQAEAAKEGAKQEKGLTLFHDNLAAIQGYGFEGE